MLSHPPYHFDGSGKIYLILPATKVVEVRKKYNSGMPECSEASIFENKCVKETHKPSNIRNLDELKEEAGMFFG